MEYVKIKYKRIKIDGTQKNSIEDKDSMIHKRIRINSNLSDIDEDLIQKKILELINKLEFNLIDISIDIDILYQRTGMNDQSLIITNLLLQTLEGEYNVMAESRHFTPCFYKALIKLETQIINSRKNHEQSHGRFVDNLADHHKNKTMGSKIIIRKLHNDGLVAEA